MDEEFSANTTELLEAASDFAHHPGVQSDASAKDFLDRFPLPAIINALQTKADTPGLEDALVACLERIFRIKYGASLIPQYMPFAVVGLGAYSQKVRCLACKTVSCLLENIDEAADFAVQLVLEYDIYPLLLNCLIDGYDLLNHVSSALGWTMEIYTDDHGREVHMSSRIGLLLVWQRLCDSCNEQVATASMDAIKRLAGSKKGMDIVFPSDTNETTHLRNLMARSSSLGRVRVLALIVKLFSISNSVASVIYNSNLLSLLEAEVSNSNDTLEMLNVLELLYELSEIQHSTEFLSRTTLLQLLSSMISDASVESILRSRAMMISGRLLSKGDALMFINKSSVRTFISAIAVRLRSLESQDADECECALEALGQIGSSIQGAELLLSSSIPAAGYVVDAAFDRHGHGKQLAALDALGNIAGESRSENNKLLSGDAEEILRRLIYEKAFKTSKLTPSGLFLSVLQLESDIRLAGYRVIAGLVARTWCLMEICSRQEIISIVTDTNTETSKIGMEARHNCCHAIHKAFMSSIKLASDPTFGGIAAKLNEAIRRGPYLTRKHPEAQPEVMTAERF